MWRTERNASGNSATPQATTTQSLQAAPRSPRHRFTQSTKKARARTLNTPSVEKPGSVAFHSLMRAARRRASDLDDEAEDAEAERRRRRRSERAACGHEHAEAATARARCRRARA